MPDAVVISTGSSLSLSLVLPTYNERSNLRELVRRLTELLDDRLPGDYELIVVDDDSPDRTWELAEQIAGENPSVRVIRRTNERGLSSAVVTGWMEARGAILGVIDADLQHPPATLLALLDQVEAGADIAVASRHADGGGVSDWSVHRRILSRGAQALGLLLLPEVIGRIGDPMSGFFLVQRDAVAGRPLRPLGYKILIEVLAKGRIDRIAETGYVFQERVHGDSKVTRRQYVQYLQHLWLLRRGDPLGWLAILRFVPVIRLMKFGAVGLSGVVVDMVLLYLLSDPTTLGLGLTRSKIIAAEVAILNNFLWNDMWTFRDLAKADRGAMARLRRLLKFNLICLGGLAINVVVLNLLFNVFDMNRYLANLIAIGVVTAWNFGMNLGLNWRSAAAADAPSSAEGTATRWGAPPLDALVGAVTLAAGVLYFTGLDRQSLWLDELYTATGSTGTLADIAAFWEWDRHPPTYSFLLYGWTSLFGDGEIAMRSLSAIAALLVLPTVYLFGRRLMPARIAATATILLAGSATVLYYAQEARVYALLLLGATLATLAWLDLLRAMRTGDARGEKVRYAIVACLTALLHYYGGAFVAFQLAWLGLVALRQGGLRRLPVVTMLVALGPATAELLLHLPYLRAGIGEDGWIGRPDLGLAKSIVAHYLSANEILVGAILGIPPLALIVAGPRRAVRHVRKVLALDRHRTLLPLAYAAIVPLLAMAALSFVVPTLIPRNTMVFMPATILLVAWWLSLAPILGGWRLPAFAIAFAVASLALYLPEHLAPHKQQWREAALEVVEEADRDTLVATLERSSETTALASGIGRSRLWRYYLDPAGANFDEQPFANGYAAANSAEGMELLVDAAQEAGAERILLFYAHVPDLDEEAMGVLERETDLAERHAFYRSGVYELVLEPR